MDTNPKVAYEYHEKSFQTRSEELGLQYFPTFKEALDYANTHKSVWRISFYVGNERIRLNKTPDYNYWILESII